MSDVRVSAAGTASVWQSYAPRRTAGAAEAQPQPQSQTQTAQDQPLQARAPDRVSKEEEEVLTILEMMRQAREKAEETRKRLQIPKNPSRYGDAAMMAYARLARAKNKAQVNSATGYARRQIAQMKAALRQDPENAQRIRAAINQLQKAVSRGNKKKKDLDREKLMDSQRARAQRENQRRKAQRIKHELSRRQAMRSIREKGYLREAEIDNKFQDQLSATSMELRAQAQSLAAAVGPSVGAAVQQYTAQSAAGATPAPGPEPGGGMDFQA